MNLDRLAVHKHRLESLDAQAVKGRRAVQENRVFLDHVFENVPNDGLLALNHFARLLDRGGVLVFLKLVVNKWLEKLEGHLFRQPALVKFQLRADNNHRTARVIDTLSKQVLTETSLLALQCAGKRFQRAIIRSAKHAAAAAIVEQS